MIESEHFVYYVNAIYSAYGIHYMNIVIFNIYLFTQYIFYIDLISKFVNGQSPCKFSFIVDTRAWPDLLEIQTKH